jgi:hypothetical protein
LELLESVFWDGHGWSEGNGGGHRRGWYSVNPGGRAVVPLNWWVASPKYSQIPGQLNCNIVLIKYNWHTLNPKLQSKHIYKLLQFAPHSSKWLLTSSPPTYSLRYGGSWDASRTDCYCRWDACTWMHYITQSGEHCVDVVNRTKRNSRVFRVRMHFWTQVNTMKIVTTPFSICVDCSVFIFDVAICRDFTIWK